MPQRIARSLPFDLRLFLGVIATANVLGAIAIIPDRGGDFAMLYDSTASWLHHQPPYVAVQSTTNLNPPLLWLVVAPLVALPQPAAFVVWTIASLGSFLVAARLVQGAIGVSDMDIALVTLSLTGTAFELALGQVAFLLLVPFTGAWWFARTGRTAAAGGCLGLLAAFKPFFGLFALPFVLNRNWRALVTMAAAAIGLHVLGVAIAGADAYREWFRNLQGITWTWHIFNASVWGTAARVFSEQPFAIAASWRPIVVSPVAAALVGWGGTAVTLALLATVLPRADADHQFALVSLASLLISPLGWTYYLPTIFAPVLAVVARCRSRWLWPIGGMAMCPYALLVNRSYGVLGTIVVGQISLVVVAGLFALAFTSARASATSVSDAAMTGWS